MAQVVRIDPFSREIDVFVDQHLSLDAQKQALGSLARDVLEDARQTNLRALGHMPRHDTFVDGRENAPLESINPERGVIVFDFHLIGEIFGWISEQLISGSPSRSGTYRRSHTFFADGREVPIGGFVPAAAEYTFLNPVPYARKVEVGRTRAGRPFVISVPNHLYERTANRARRLFGNLATILFTYQAAIGGGIVPYQPAGSAHAARSAIGGDERNARVPAIVIRPK